MLAVLLVSTYWGLGLGLLTALASALAFNFFHTPPTGHFTIANAQNYVALGVFLIAAAIASTVAEPGPRARSRGRAPARGGRPGRRAGAPAARRDRPARRPRLHRASLGRGVRPAVGGAGAPPRRRRSAAPRPAAGYRRRPRGDPAGPRLDRPATLERLRERVVPALEALLAAALDREPLQAEVVETQALRQSDSVKTALLRAVSHDLRTPLTTIVTASAAVAPRGSAPGSARSSARASVSRRAACPGSSTSCSTSRGWRPGRPTRGATGRSIEELIRTAADEVGDGGRRRLHAARRPRPAADRRSTPRSSSAPS